MMGQSLSKAMQDVITICICDGLISRHIEDQEQPRSIPRLSLGSSSYRMHQNAQVESSRCAKCKSWSPSLESDIPMGEFIRWVLFSNFLKRIQD